MMAQEMKQAIQKGRKISMSHPVAIVTGATRGIGRAVALELASHGYDLAVNYHSNEKAAREVCDRARAMGVRAEPVYADMGKVEDIAAMYAEIDRLFPRIDLLVNNAGISDEVYFLDATPENFDRMTAVDWRGLYFCAQYAAKRMIEKKVPGLIINVTSNQAEGNWPR